MTREEAIKFLNEQKEFLLKGCFWEETRMNINEAFDMAIEALEADVPDTNVGDMISRKAAIDAVYLQSDDDGWWCGTAEDMETLLKGLPSVQPEQQWIPVGERLPEDIKPVIVTWENIDPKSYYQYIVGKRFIGTAHYKNGKWFWYSSVTEDLLSEYGRCDSEEFDEAIEVISWMPLPEPYKEDKDA